ncbi:hypothetical protein MA16_Dca005262 [Dendrobium catenatum]|uniref:Uncharacterized protein n=1 Tax=Dendrobium catenatum TaxID=906689 RepID=A0A2I0VLP7_9ASPA|nr:hypothetical protein MA16_Dca005262 [Dendrobium catenatum]
MDKNNQASKEPQKKATGNPYPKRGEIKTKIFKDMSTFIQGNSSSSKNDEEDYISTQNSNNTSDTLHQ